MEFRQLKVFAAVAETKSFSKAAEYLFLSQSTVSSHIKNLEKELHTTLFIRSTSSVRLSADGAVFLWYAKRILETKEAALEALNTSSESLIHLGASTIPSAYLLPQLLNGFRMQHPEILFDIRQEDSSRILEKILDGTLELGIVGDKEENPRYTYIPLCEDELVLVTPATEYYQALKRTNPDMKTLLKEPMILREHGSGTRKTADLFLESIGMTQKDLHIIAQINDLESGKQMIQMGMGVSIFSKFAVKNMEASGQALVYPLTPSIRRHFYLVFLKSKTQKRILYEFMEYAQKMWREPGAADAAENRK
ncbi:MAG: selenium metabolism-associated LysR family transcriptional regulator [Lachnospiraceae bacterium]|nr:selenium metabolism-associated LysR family transcriptional regulator [Lachnospiraceae bacterium]